MRSGKLPNDGGVLIGVLHGWGVIDETVAVLYAELERQRHDAVHFRPELRADRREPALAALQALQEIIEAVLEPHGGPPRWIDGTPGVSFIALEAEKEPLVGRIFLSHCALVSPAHRLEHQAGGSEEWVVLDGSDDLCKPLNDSEFARRFSGAQGKQGDECGGDLARDMTDS